MSSSAASQKSSVQLLQGRLFHISTYSSVYAAFPVSRKNKITIMLFCHQRFYLDYKEVISMVKKLHNMAPENLFWRHTGLYTLTTCSFGANPVAGKIHGKYKQYSESSRIEDICNIQGVCRKRSVSSLDPEGGGGAKSIIVDNNRIRKKAVNRISSKMECSVS
jgi:hypothetical protein